MCVVASAAALLLESALTALMMIYRLQSSPELLHERDNISDLH